MKDYEEYKKEHTAIDWVIRDLIIEQQRQRKALIILCIGLTIAGIVGMIF